MHRVVAMEWGSWEVQMEDGYDVNTSQPNGNVFLNKNSKLNIEIGQGVTIKNGFSMERGATLTIE